MITKFKIYENINEGEPKIGDYVICTTINNKTPELLHFLSNNIGKYIQVSKYISFPYQIQFYNIPKSMKFYFGHNPTTLNM